ncbi:MAG: Slp family lipoprotein [Rudaea sp.]
MMARAAIVIVIAALTSSACAFAASPVAAESSSIGIEQARSQALAGSAVRWGGIVIGAHPTDQGQCLEVAYFPITKYSHTPYDKESNQDGFRRVLWYARQLQETDAFADGASTNAWPVRTAPPAGSLAGPRFLACQPQTLDATKTRPGTVVTLTGKLEATRSTAAGTEVCRDPNAAWHGDASGSDPQNCLVSVPIVALDDIVAWKSPAYFDHRSPQAVGGYGG